jgi:hypothetical protein
MSLSHVATAKLWQDSADIISQGILSYDVSFLQFLNVGFCPIIATDSADFEAKQQCVSYKTIAFNESHQVEELHRRLTFYGWCNVMPSHSERIVLEPSQQDACFKWYE